MIRAFDTQGEEYGVLVLAFVVCRMSRVHIDSKMMRDDWWH